MKNTLNSMINSQGYWDERFQEDWEEKHGREQTKMFYKVMIENLPDFINEYIKTKTETICDVGCALGEGTNLIQKAFPKQKVEGSDFSSVAVADAQKRYPKLKFSVQDITNLSNKYDVIIASNIIEHFQNPLNVIDQVLNNTKKILIIMLPFQEDKNNLGKEHFQSFDFENFSLRKNGANLIYSREIDLRGTKDAEYWDGKQILLIYAKDKNLMNEELSLENFSSRNYDTFLKSQDEGLLELRESVNQKNDKIAQLEALNLQINTNQQRLQELNNSLYEKILSLEEELHTIKHSKAWHLIQNYYNMLGKHPRLRNIIKRISPR